MSTTRQSPPTVLVFSGLDPSGGAGIQADIEALASHGCHACPIVTSLTVQNTSDVQSMQAVDEILIMDQARSILEDSPISAIKIGLVGSSEIATTIHTILNDYPEIPVVLDPVLASNANTPLATEEIREAILNLLVPRTTILTPNIPEAMKLAPEADNIDACAMQLLEQGSEFVLVTGAHANTEQVSNTLYGQHRKLESYQWPRLPGEYHGSGCTLASSISGLLAHGNEPLTATLEAQEYTWESLNQAYRTGAGQSIPNRLFWAKSES